MVNVLRDGGTSHKIVSFFFILRKCNRCDSLSNVTKLGRALRDLS